MDTCNVHHITHYIWIHTSSSLSGCSRGVKENLSTSSENGGFQPYVCVYVYVGVCVYVCVVCVICVLVIEVCV